MGGANFVTIGAVPDAGSDGVQGIDVNVSLANSSATVIAAVSGKRISVHGGHLSPSTAAIISILDGTVVISGPMVISNGTPWQLDWQNYPHFTASLGNALIFSSAATVQVGGRLLYMQG